MDHIHNLVCVLKRLKEAGLKLKPSKCNLLRKEVKYLGHVISEEGISTGPDKPLLFVTGQFLRESANCCSF